jgi:hypothetical protein
MAGARRCFIGRCFQRHRAWERRSFRAGGRIGENRLRPSNRFPMRFLRAVIYLQKSLDSRDWMGRGESG